MELSVRKMNGIPVSVLRLHAQLPCGQKVLVSGNDFQSRGRVIIKLPIEPDKRSSEFPDFLLRSFEGETIEVSQRHVSSDGYFWAVDLAKLN